MFKLTTAQIRAFEQDQKSHGTRVALGNFLWQLGADLMKAAGVTRIRTLYGETRSKNARKAA